MMKKKTNNYRQPVIKYPTAVAVADATAPTTIIFSIFFIPPSYCHTLTWYNLSLMLYKPSVTEYQNAKKTALNTKKVAVYQ